ncbi:MAG: TerD family protein [Nostoc sp.]|uniref:TerD family protein n=1 Tax=Nostoc sp. TaxID=1180 RepID=UPI002FF776AC
MEIELSKGGRFNLSKEAPNLNKVAIGLGWQINQAGQSYDIDASVFMLDANGKIPDEKYFIFYNNLQSIDGSLKHSGDNRTGEGNGDDETIYVDLAKVNPAIQEIVFVVTIHEGQEKTQNFSQIKNAFIKIYNYESKNYLARYNLREAFSQETSLEFGRLYKKENEWRFQAVGEGYSSGLQSFVDKYIRETKQEEKKEYPKLTIPEDSHKNQNNMTIQLKKSGDSHNIDLNKSSDSTQLIIHVNLNWNRQKSNIGGLFKNILGGNKASDLDLGCMYEMVDGQKGVIQPLGNSFGSKNSSPYIFLDKDDRTGAAANGENIYIFRPDLIKRVMFFALIYQGTRDFKSVQGRIFFKISNGEEVFLELNNPDNNRRFCAAAMIKTIKSQVIITKEEKYFLGHEEASKNYRFGINWTAGSK